VLCADGSSWYNLTSNFFVFGGHKSDFQGHNKLSYQNVNAYPGVYGPRCVMLQALPQVGPNSRDGTGGSGNWDEAYSSNKCILATEDETCEKAPVESIDPDVTSSVTSSVTVRIPLTHDTAVRTVRQTFKWVASATPQTSRNLASC
jgi:hypothetical protein